jgi:hypothetical protein
MKVLQRRPSVGALALAVAMFSVVALAAFGPATGVVAASSSCTYGTCTDSGPGPLTYALGIILAAIILLIAAAVIFQRRRGSQPPSGGVAAWSGGATPPGASGPAESPAAGETAPYMESAEDVGTMGGGVAIAGGAAAAGAAAGAAASEEAPGDIDSLMGELDRISGEILQRGPGKKPPTGGADAEPPGSGS